MVRFAVLLAALLAAFAVGRAAPPAAGPGRDAPPKRIVGYFTEWGIYDRKYNVADIPADKLTHVNYAFAKIDDNGECAVCDPFAAVDKAFPGDGSDAGALRGNFHQMQILKKKHPHLKTLISVGGWTQSGRFSDAALTEASRGKFARSCVAFLTKYGFDGVDIDWEYPCGGGMEGNKSRPADRENFTLLLAELRKQLDARDKGDGRHYLLTFAAPTGPKMIEGIELAKAAPLVDWVNLMTYDFHGGWSPITNFNAPLYRLFHGPRRRDLPQALNVDAAVRATATAACQTIRSWSASRFTAAAGAA